MIFCSYISIFLAFNSFLPHTREKTLEKTFFGQILEPIDYINLKWSMVDLLFFNIVIISNFGFAHISASVSRIFEILVPTPPNIPLQGVHYYFGHFVFWHFSASKAPRIKMLVIFLKPTKF